MEIIYEIVSVGFKHLIFLKENKHEMPVLGSRTIMALKGVQSNVRIFWYDILVSKRHNLSLKYKRHTKY